MKIITSPDNPELKEAKKLHDAKHRKETGLFFFEGVHLLEEYLKTGKKPYRLFLTEKVSDLYKDSDEKRIISQKLYDKITAENAPQGIFTIAHTSSVNVIRGEYEDILNSLDAPAVVLESMRDPGNVGTVIRTAVSLGVKIIFTEDSADIFNPKVIRASMGAIFADSIYIVPSATELSKAAVSKGFQVFGAILDEKAKRIGSFIPTKNSLFIIGNEGSGIKKETLDECNNYAYIPMTGKTESLNAAVAASLIIWEISKNNGENNDK
ncbi:MAG: RNA methyltransferase [Ruminococcaceae bacterium]|nr:RNA methyltransferase [Oscillospiraceae bacterium]